MINDQMVSFIKQQIDKGINKETISKKLLSSDWTFEDIEEGFNAINLANQNKIEEKVPVLSQSKSQPGLQIEPKIESQFIPQSKPQIEPIAENQFQPQMEKPNPIVFSGIHTTSNWTDYEVGKNSHDVRNVLLIVFGLLLFVGIIFGYIFRTDLPIIKDYFKDKSEVVEVINKEQITESQISNVETSEMNTQPPVNDAAQDDALFARMNNAIIDASENVTTKNEGIDCKEDMICFMDATRDCSPSFVDSVSTVNVLGMFNQTNRQKLSLKGFNYSKKCVYTSLVEDVVSLEYTSEMQEFLKNEIAKQGKILTDEQMIEALKVPQKSVDSAKNTVGTTIVCSFTTDYLLELFNKWSKGSYSTEDMNSGNCTATNANGENITIM